MSSINLIGTSHIAKESIKAVISNIEKNQPDIVAIELDPGRLYGLKNKVERPKNIELIKRIGMSGFAFYVIGEFIQQKLGKIVSIQPGSEMLAAYDEAVKEN